MRKKATIYPVTILILVAFYICMDQSDLPDYEAYQRIYEYSVLGADWEIFFIFVNFFFRVNGLSYDDFRNFILIFSSCGLSLVLHRIPAPVNIKFKKLRILDLITMFFILSIFIFEYFVIRIRAGFAIGMVLWAVYFLVSTKKSIGWIISGVLLFLAFYTHQSTTTVLMIFLGLPLIAAMWKGNTKSKEWLFRLAAVGSVVFVLYMTHVSYGDRGEEMFSPLNPVRFALLSLVPLLLVFTIKNESKMVVISGDIMRNFPIYFARFYTLLAASLVPMFFIGLTDESGEAIVRLYTLASIPALLSLGLLRSIFSARFSAYILTINCLFFFATVFLAS